MSTSVLETAKQIRKNILNNSFNPNEFKEFQIGHPKFYEMLQKKDMNEEMFQKLIEILSFQSVDNQDAASQFSQFGAEKFLYPKFGKPSEADIQNAKSKIEKMS